MVDCHVHVFDPGRFPYRPDTFYAPAGQELGTPARLGGVLDAHGVGHALLVGPNSGYGEDNGCLLDTVAAGSGRYRGMAVVPVMFTAELISVALTSAPDGVKPSVETSPPVGYQPSA